MRRLEKLYRKIGALTELRRLDMWVTYDVRALLEIEGEEHSRHDMETAYKKVCFPGMLTIGDGNTDGRWGFLEVFAGLDKLEIIEGSFNVLPVVDLTPEYSCLIGEREVRWMAKHWPLLKHADLLQGFSCRNTEEEKGEGEKKGSDSQLPACFKLLDELLPRLRYR